MGYVPDLHKIWVGTSDQQLMALSNEFPGFYRYVLIMEEASEAERNKASRPYDGMAGGETELFCTLPPSPPPRHLENRVPAQIAERASIAAASRDGQFAHFRVVTPSLPLALK